MLQIDGFLRNLFLTDIVFIFVLVSFPSEANSTNQGIDFFRSGCDLHMQSYHCRKYQMSSMNGQHEMGSINGQHEISAFDWLGRQFLAVVLAFQSEVACICTLSAFYHMAKQHSRRRAEYWHERRHCSSNSDVLQTLIIL